MGLRIESRTNIDDATGLFRLNDDSRLHEAAGAHKVLPYKMGSFATQLMRWHRMFPTPVLERSTCC